MADRAAPWLVAWLPGCNLSPGQAQALFLGQVPHFQLHRGVMHPSLSSSPTPTGWGVLSPVAMYVLALP